MNENQYREFKACWLVALIILLGFLQKDIHADAMRVAKSSESLAMSVQALTSGTLTGIASEQAHLDAQLQETRKTTADIHDLVIHTDLNLNGKKGALTQLNANILPNVVAVLGSTDSAVRGIGHDSHVVLGSVDSDVRGILPLENALTEEVAGIKPILGKFTDLEESARPAISSMAETSQHLAGTSANLEATSADVAAFTHRELAPARGIKNTIKTILSWTGSVRLAIGF
jgi:hypothetical protein